MTETFPGAASDQAWRLIASLAAVLGNAYFVAAEFALVRSRPTRIARLVDEGRRGAGEVSRILERLDYYLSACQLGNTLSSLVIGWLAEPTVAALLLRGAVAAGLPLQEGPLTHALAFGLSLAVITVLHMTIGEQSPKFMAIQKAEEAALLLVYPLLAFAVVFRPLIWVINGATTAIVRLAGFSSSLTPEGTHDVEELRAIFRASSKAGLITERQEAMGGRVLGLMKREVRHIMVPRGEIASMTKSRTLEENLEVVRRNGHSRYPLCDPDFDSVVGMVHVRDVLYRMIAGERPDLTTLVRAVATVPDTQPLSRFIVQLQRAQVHCAVVVDEHGINVGLAFLEDALEEIVGPIPDEFDKMDPRISRPTANVIEMAGAVSLPEAAETLDLDLGDEHDTIGGYVVAALGRIPAAGDSVDLPDYKISILKVVRGRVARLRFEAKQEPAGQ
jgi:CBS domain containing-hemolysin-like protein